MKKSILALLLVLVLPFTVVGCGDDANSKSDSQQSEEENKTEDVVAISEIMKSADSICANGDVAAGSMFEIISTANSVKVELKATSAKDADDEDTLTTEELQKTWSEYANFKSNEYTLKAKAFKKLSGTATGIVEANGSVTWTNAGDLFDETNKDSMTKHSKDFNYKFVDEDENKSIDVSAISEIMKSADGICANGDVAAGSTFEFISAANSDKVELKATSAKDADDEDTLSTEELQKVWVEDANFNRNEYTLKAKAFKTLAGTATGIVETNGSVTWTKTGDLFDETNKDSMTKHSKDFNYKFSE